MAYIVSLRKNMKTLIAFLLCAAGCVARASEPGFVATYQPLGGVPGGDVLIERVMCVSKYAFSDDTKTAPITLIHKAYSPPTDTGASGDYNLASKVGLEFRVDWALPDQPKFVLDASKLATKTKVLEVTSLDRELVVLVCLECLRRCTPAKLMDVEVILIAKDADKPDLEKIVQKYNKHKKDSPFFGSGS
jgi:hypothetical protein